MLIQGSGIPHPARRWLSLDLDPGWRDYKVSAHSADNIRGQYCLSVGLVVRNYFMDIFFEPL